MTSLILSTPSTFSNNDFHLVKTEAQVHTTESAQSNQDDIPYHARENAEPFSYGNVPDGFSKCGLKHVEIEESPSSRKNTPSAVSYSPSTIRKHNRPSISPSRPILRKTPSRQEFEEMLLERKEQAAREQNNTATKLAQNAAIQNDLDELQEKLNKKVYFDINVNNSYNKKDVMKITNAIESANQPKDFSTDVEQIISTKSETPAFPLELRNYNKRSDSPYLSVLPAHTSANARLPDETLLELQEINFPMRALTDTHEVDPHLVKFAKDNLEFWYKPYITRMEANDLLKNANPGTFIIRNSTTYKNAYGLVLRVATPPSGIVVDGSNNDELVRHFLLEPSTSGVRLKGCANEPLFASLSAFVYEHSINKLALPHKLTIPDKDIVHFSGDQALIAAQKQVLNQGAACNVLFLYTCNTESLTGDEAVRKAVCEMYTKKSLPKPVEVHFKVSQQGITLTDNTRSKFFRRHFCAQNVSHIGIDPDNRFWSVTAYDEGLERVVNKNIFAFVARPLTGARDNQCHVFCDLAANQPASAIVSFSKKVLPLNISGNEML